MLSCSIWFSAPSFWMCGGLEILCLGRVCGADVAVHRTHDLRRGSQDHNPSKNSVHKTNAATQNIMLLMTGECTRNMSR